MPLDTSILHLFNGHGLGGLEEKVLALIHFDGLVIAVVAARRQIPQLDGNIHLLGLDVADLLAVLLHVLIGELYVEALGLRLAGLEARVAQHAGLPEGPIHHLVTPSVSRGLGHIDL